MKSAAQKFGKFIGRLLYLVIYFSPILGSSISIIQGRSPGSPPGTPNWGELFVMLVRYVIFVLIVYYLR